MRILNIYILQHINPVYSREKETTVYGIQLIHLLLGEEVFTKEIPVTEDDFIDIHNPDISPDDIFHFLDHPIPMCKWCKTRRPMMGWGISKKEIDEWIGGEINPFSHFLQIRKYQAISKYHQYKQITEMKKRNRYEH